MAVRATVGGPEHRRDPAWPALYSTGLVAGAFVVGAVALAIGGIVSPIPGDVRTVAVVVVCLIAVVRDLSSRAKVLIPGRRRQIPQRVLFDQGRVGVVQFGFEMGTGIRTYLTSAAPVPVLAYVVLVDPAARVVALAVLGFSLGRYLPTALVTAAREDRLDRPELAALAAIARPTTAIVATAITGLAFLGAQ